MFSYSVPAVGASAALLGCRFGDDEPSCRFRHPQRRTRDKEDRIPGAQARQARQLLEVLQYQRSQRNIASTTCGNTQTALVLVPVPSLAMIPVIQLWLEAKARYWRRSMAL